MPTELESQIALGLIRGVGDRNIKNLISYCGSAKKVFQTTKGKLMKIPGLGHKIANEISSANPFKEVASIIKKCEQLKIDIIPFSDKRKISSQIDSAVRRTQYPIFQRKRIAQSQKIRSYRGYTKWYSIWKIYY